MAKLCTYSVLCKVEIEVAVSVYTSYGTMLSLHMENVITRTEPKQFFMEVKVGSGKYERLMFFTIWHKIPSTHYVTNFNHNTHHTIITLMHQLAVVSSCSYG